MSRENEGHRDWRVEASDFFPNGAVVGFTYEGNHGQHQGKFVPVQHFARSPMAETYQREMLAGNTRMHALSAAIAWADVEAHGLHGHLKNGSGRVS